MGRLRLPLAGPPCSLFVWLSSSVHKRRPGRLLGDTSVRKVRLSNLIVENLVALLRIAFQRGVWWVMEQPTSSWMFKQDSVMELRSRCAAQLVVTFMGQFGHEMCKPTHLCSTLPTIGLLARGRPGRSSGLPGEGGRSSGLPGEGGRSSNTTTGRCFYTRSGRAVTGGRDLQSSAAYTQAFSEAVHAAWQAALSQGSQPERKQRRVEKYGASCPGLKSCFTILCV